MGATGLNVIDFKRLKSGNTLDRWATIAIWSVVFASAVFMVFAAIGVIAFVKFISGA